MTEATYRLGGGARQRTPLWALGVGLVLAGLRGSQPRREPPARRQQPARREAHDEAPSDKRHPFDHTRKTDARDFARAEQPGRGREADHPGEIPARGWKDILWRIYEGINEDRILAISGGVVFFTLLAIFPGIAGLIALYGLFADPGTIAQHIDTLAGVVPGGGIDIIREQVERLTAQPPQRLGIAMAVSLGIALWSANGGVKAIFDALNVVYHENEKRSFIRLNALSLTFTLGGILFVLIAIAMITILPAALAFVGLSRTTELLLKIGRWPVMLLVVSFAIALIYRYGPSRDEPQWRWITPGSIFATVAWLIASLLFSWYAENFGSYNATYGSLGTVIGFMTWMWISTIVVLVGAKLNAEIEHQTARDTTDGHPQPLGSRGATMADNVGKPSD
jgi:membrane protein